MSLLIRLKRAIYARQIEKRVGGSMLRNSLLYFLLPFMVACSGQGAYQEVTTTRTTEVFVVDAPVQGFPYRLPNGVTGVSGVGGYIPLGEGAESITLVLGGIEIVHRVEGRFIFLDDL